MIPIIMAGGFGTRIRPLSANIPKPLLPVVNRPILELVLENLRQHGMREAILLTYHEPAKIRQALGDGSRFGMKLTFYQAEQDYGTAGAVAHGAQLVPSDRYLVLSGDVVCDFDLSAILRFHEAKKAKVTITLTRVANPLQFGIVIVDGDFRIRRFLEKPTWGEVFSDTVNTGVYVLQAEVLKEVPLDEPYDFSRDLFPRLLQANVPLYGCVVQGYWRDIGDPESYLEVHQDFFAGTLRLIPAGTLRQVGGRPYWAEGSVEVASSAEVRGTVVLGEGCRVGEGARLEDVVLGPQVEVGEGAEVRRSVVWTGSRLGAGTRLERAVVGAGVQTGEHVVIEQGAIVADATVLGRGVRVKEGVKIWPSKVVEDHAVVHSNLVYAERWRTSAFEEGAVTGLTNLELTPEVAARLGAAYGTLLAPGSTILTARDGHPASRMLRRAFVGGVGSTGVHVVDLGLMPVPVLRYKLKGFGEKGGVSFQQVQLVRGMTSIRFFDEHGVDISTAFAKSVERVFLREEFRRVRHQEIGLIFEQPRVLDLYAEAYLKALGEGPLSQRYRLVVDYAHSAAVVILPRLLAELGCDVVTLNAHTEREEALLPADIPKALERLAAIVKALEAHMGVFLYPDGEKLVVLDDQGRIWQGMELVSLFIALLVAQRPAGGEVVLPAFAPSTFARTLEAANIRVRETLSAPRALIEASRQKGVIFASAGDGDFIFPVLHCAPDALFAVGSFIKAASEVGEPLSELAKRAPKTNVAHWSIPCPVEKKGRIMRQVVDRCAGLDMSFLEGVKVTRDEGWVLLRPDRLRPALHVHAEGPTQQAAHQMAAAFAAQVEELVRQD
ncbi:MAG: sugar phosphate nucleotidyltransferase [Thermoanaerobaculum sp.]|nr:sugar phosphate nucleotidyltransferase [Thermoanaerobaculum sp.]MDW7968058.1 sugar phosphate nucleotidyltransferase [Thermoanaerobaculum sp.]